MLFSRTLELAEPKKKSSRLDSRINKQMLMYESIKLPNNICWKMMMKFIWKINCWHDQKHHIFGHNYLSFIAHNIYSTRHKSQLTSICTADACGGGRNARNHWTAINVCAHARGYSCSIALHFSRPTPLEIRHASCQQNISDEKYAHTYILYTHDWLTTQSS